MWCKNFWLTLLLCGWMSSLVAQEVHFTVTAERVVEGDESTAQLRVRHVSQDLGEASLLVNKDVAWLKEQLSEFPQLQLESVAYRSWTYPRQQGDEQTSMDWEVQQDLLIRCEDRQLLAQVLGNLQQKAALTSFDVDLSPSLLREVNDALTDEVLARVNERAERVAKALGFTEYRLSSLTLRDGDVSPASKPLLMSARLGGDVLEGPEPGTGTTKVEISAQVVVLLRGSSRP